MRSSAHSLGTLQAKSKSYKLQNNHTHCVGPASLKCLMLEPKTGKGMPVCFQLVAWVTNSFLTSLILLFKGILLSNVSHIEGAKL